MDMNDFATIFLYSLLAGAVGALLGAVWIGVRDWGKFDWPGEEKGIYVRARADKSGTADDDAARG